MRVRICKEVEVDTEVTIGIEEIQIALSEVADEAAKRPRAFSVEEYIVACWQCLNAVSDDQIARVSLNHRQHVARGLRELADRFARDSVSGKRGG